MSADPDLEVTTPGMDQPAGTAADPTAGGASSRRFGLYVPKTALIVYLICRIATVGSVLVANVFTHRSVLYDLEIWDGKWFLAAVHSGYPAHLPMAHGHVLANPIAFFPLLPMVITVLGWIGLPVGPAGLLVSAITGATAVVGVATVTRRIADEDAAGRAALLFALFPATFIFSLIYSEGIVITCVAFGLVALLDRRWLVAGCLGALATAASPVALAFCLSCAWCAIRAIRTHRQWRAVTAPLMAPLGFVGYMLYLWLHTGVVMAWRMTERGGWKSYPSLLYPVSIMTTFGRDPIAPTLTGQILFVGTMVGMAGIWLMWRVRQPTVVWLYGTTALILAAVSAPVGLRPRFILLAFPVIMAVGQRFTGTTYRMFVVASTIGLLAVTALEVGRTSVFP